MDTVSDLRSEALVFSCVGMSPGSARLQGLKAQFPGLSSLLTPLQGWGSELTKPPSVLRIH